MEVEVAVPAPLPQTFTYLSDGEIQPGCRVVVPFGGRKMVGVVLKSNPASDVKREYALKPVAEIVDKDPVYSASILSIAKWLSWYYIHPLGEVLRTMLPASSAKISKKNYVLTAKGEKALAESDE